MGMAALSIAAKAAIPQPPKVLRRAIQDANFQSSLLVWSKPYCKSNQPVRVL
jgi:hypothetical protein